MENRRRPRNPRYVEKISTRIAAGRPALSAALGYLRAGDILVVWKLDRLGRPVKECSRSPMTCTRGIGVRILTGSCRQYSPTGEGKFFFTTMAVFAELERDIIDERTMAVLVAAKAQGRTGGPLRDGRGQAGGGQGAPGPRREPRQARQGPRRQPRLDLPAPGG